MADKYYTRTRTEMLDYIPAECHVCLDVGCANGAFGSSLKQQQPAREVWGIEISRSAAEQAGSVLDKVLIGDAMEVIDELPDHHFDCICFNDSLEHMVDPYTILERMRPKLKNDASRIVASIPNIRYYKPLFGLVFQKDWRYADAGVLDMTHLRFFTRKSIQRMFHDAGYKVQSITGVNRTRKVKVRIWRWLSLGWLNDIEIMQYACVATPAGTVKPDYR